MKTHPLKVERELRGWSQAKLAEALGTTIRSVSRWEQGLALPYPHYREQLCLLFGKTAKQLGLLMDEEETMQKTALAGNPKMVRMLPKQQTTSFLIDPAIPESLGSGNSLHGRSGLLKQVKQRLLSDRSSPSAALSGLPGIGKTTIAVAIAMDRRIQAHFSDGILWAGLGPRPNVLGLLARWGALLGVKPADVENVNSWESWGRALQAVTGNRRLLLIIDDAWNIQDALALQIGGPQCAHLLTTRLPQVAFAFAQQGTIMMPELEEVDGLALLAGYVPQLIEQDTENARKLVRAVGGLPLALTLMGKYLAAQVSTGQPRRLQAALTRLRDTEQRLQVTMPTVPGERPPCLPENVPLSLHAAITISARQLSPQDHAALCALAVFPPKPNSFSEEAALAVTQEPGEMLDRLWDAGLLESSGPRRYALHQTIADYAHTQNQDSIACQRLVNYIVPSIQAHEQDYDLLEQEMSNIIAALDAAIALRMLQALLQGVIAFVGFLRIHGYYALADQYLQPALQAATVLEDPVGQMILLRYLATFAELRGDYPQAEHYGQLGLFLARQLGRSDEVSALLATLGLVAFYHGNNEQAITSYEEGLRLARQIGDSERICALLSDLGRVARSQGNYARAEALYHEGLALAQQYGHQELTSRLLAFLGAITREQGNYDQAEAYCLDGLDIARQQGHREHLCHLLSTLGSIAYYRGHYKQAEVYFQEGLAIARQIGHRAHIYRLLSNLGPPLTAQGDYAQAERYLEEGVELARQLGNRDWLPFLLMNLGGAVGQLGDYERANLCFQESVEVARHLGSPWLISSALRDWGEIHLKHEQLEPAAKAFEEVLMLTQSSAQQDPYLVAQALYGLARIAAARGHSSQARRIGMESFKTFATFGHRKAEELKTWLRSLP